MLLSAATSLLCAFPLLAVQDTSPQAQDLVTVSHGDTLAVTWTERQSDGSATSHYRISLDGGASFSRDRETSYELRLNYQDFDPLADGSPVVPPSLRARPGHELYIVQYVTQGLEPWRDAIRSLGAVDQRFLAWHANIWEMDAQTAAQVAELPFVRWVGEFHPAYKIETGLLRELLLEDLQPARYHVVVGDWGPVQKAVIADHIVALGGSIDQMIDEGWVLDATLTRGQLIDVVHQSEVLGVDRWTAPEDDMNNVRSLMGGNYVEGLTGFQGTGVRAEVFDSGFDGNRPEWRHTPLNHGGYNNSTHGTSTYSINFADTTSNARGMARDAQGIMADYGSYGGNRYTHTAQLNNSPYFAVYQSNSWGGGRTFNYTSTSQQMDDIIFLNDIVITQSQSNAGNQDSRPEAWAKNIVAVGGIRHYNNTNNSDDAWAGGASTGPAADGRVKPDLSAFYDSIDTVISTSFGGTSAASPIVAGHFAVFFEMWHNGFFGNTPGATVFDSRPHSTTSRAIMINSAWQWPDNQTDITRMRQGWGRPDVRYMYDNASSMFWVDETDVLTNLASKSYTVDVAAGSPEFRATLVYLDVAGTTSSSLHRINDLSLKVTSPGGTVYWGNNGLISGSYNYSTSGGVSNTKDVVEQVLLQNPAVGSWTVQVYADEINADSHTETGAVDADYALVVSGITGGGSGGFQLGIQSGSCPGSMTFAVSGQTLGGKVAWIYGSPGSFTVSGGPCAGLTVDIANPTVYQNALGTQITANVPAGACGSIRLQCVDVATCTKSNFIDL
ncbi:MAG: peptidase S8 [Planctomycetes bacterium]|nr:peptidase S8 [Planctomycetota bacterium]